MTKLFVYLDPPMPTRTKTRTDSTALRYAIQLFSASFRLRIRRGEGFLGAGRSIGHRNHDGAMATISRVQNRYEHRLVELVRPRRATCEFRGTLQCEHTKRELAKCRDIERGYASFGSAICTVSFSAFDHNANSCPPLSTELSTRAPYRFSHFSKRVM